MAMPTASAKKLRFVDDTDDMGDFPLRPGLNWRARKESEIYRTIARGTMLVSGERGSGKDLFAVSTAYMMKYYFNRPILLDFLPKRAFGPYSLFDANIMMREIRKMAKKTGVEGIENAVDRDEYEEWVGEATRDWALEGEGYDLLRNAVLVLSELKRYCPKREPHRKVNKFIGALNTVVRHLDMLIIGTHVFENEIDRFTFMQYANIRAHCEWLMTRPHTTRVSITMTSVIGAADSYTGFVGRLPPLDIDGKAPREFLGGECFFKLWRSKNYVNLIPVASKEVK